MTDAEKFEQMQHHLHRGGSQAFYWKKDGKKSIWHQAGRNGVIPLGPDVYFGVHAVTQIPPTNSKGERVDETQIRSQLAFIAAINCLFAEFDAKDYGNDKQACLQHIHNLPVPPSLIIDSGGGYHCYWLLDIPFIIANDQDRTRADHIQKAWVNFVGGDDGAKDLARVLRVPDTMNSKYTPARRVTFISDNFDLLYGLEDLEAISAPELAPEPKPATLSASAPTPHRSYARAALEDEIAHLRNAREHTRNTLLNIAAFKMGTLIGAGMLSQADVEAQLLNTAMALGLPNHEAQSTIKSGVTAGIKKPRQIPQRPLSTDNKGSYKSNSSSESHTTAVHIPDKSPVDELPNVKGNNRELRDVSQDAMLALNATGEIFVRGGELVRIKLDELEHASIEEVSESALRGMLARAANFYREHTNRDGEVIRTTIAPPLEVVRDVLSLGEWGFPPIESVIESPTMRPDGTILSAPGYDPATRVFYCPAPGFIMPDIPSDPSPKDIAAARELLYDVISDFPFVNEASRDNTIGTTVTLATRAMVDGPVPIPVIDAPQQGTGKTLLGSIAASMATGEAPNASAAPNDPEEWRKRITTELSTGKRVIVLDNVTGTLNDSSLAAVSTARFWGDRRLGTNSDILLPARAVWMVTGNNIRVGGDLVRRCYSIRLDAKVSRPWQRDNFTHPDIEGYVRIHRGALIGAALTLARAWVVAGRPKPSGIRMGGFDAWAQVVGGIMQHAGATHFLGNLTEFYENADDDTPAWESFITKLHELFGDAETTCGQVFTRLCPDPDHAATEDLSQYVPQDLAGLLDVKSRAKFTQRLGYAFKERRGKRHGDTQARIVQGKGTQHTTWRFCIGGETE